MTEGEGAVPVARDTGRFADFVTLTKPRLTLLSVLTTLAGYYMAQSGPLDLPRLAATLVGAFLIGGACGALNMVAERDLDALMRRTRERPLPAGRLNVREVQIFGWTIGIAGVGMLLVGANLLTGLLGTLTFISYLYLYTPLKRRTTLNTIVGAIPGALPPLIGWAAVRGTLDIHASLLFAILFFWQMPHFLSLSMMCREDYAAAGYRMLSVVDTDGAMTSRQTLLYCACLLPISLLPTVVGLASTAYFISASVLGLGMIALAILLVRRPEREVARRVFHASLLYLPLLLGTMAVDRIDPMPLVRLIPA